MILKARYFASVLVALLCVFAVAGEMPFPSIENGKVKLVVADSPYLLEQGAVFSAKDTLEIEPGVTVLMGEYAKLMFRGSVKIVGTDAAPIVFKSADSLKSWNGVHFVSANRPFEIKNLIIENAFRNTVFRSRGSFENVRFLNNYYGLWVDESPDVSLGRCLMSHNRYALSVRAGRVVSTETNISENVYGLYLETEGKVDGDTDLIRNNQESDIRSEATVLKLNKKRVRRNVWHNIEALF